MGITPSHLKQHRVQANSKCKTCGKVYLSLYLLESYIDVHRTEEKATQITQVSKQNSEPVKSSSNVSVKKATCSLCGETVNSQAELPLHKCKGKRVNHPFKRIKNLLFKVFHLNHPPSLWIYP